MIPQMRCRRGPFLVHLLVSLAPLLLAALLPTKSSGGEAPAVPSPPRQEIWYHTGYPGGVAGQPGGISALTGPTWNVSIHGASMGGPPGAANNHIVQVHHGRFTEGSARGTNNLAAIDATVPGLIERQRPDPILYQAGMDPTTGPASAPRPSLSATPGFWPGATPGWIPWCGSTRGP
jgi:hypothetical protein